jgi:hypothetical protein
MTSCSHLGPVQVSLIHECISNVDVVFMLLFILTVPYFLAARPEKAAVKSQELKYQGPILQLK